MACPICANTYISDDVSVAERKGARVILRGTVKAVVSPNEAHYSPFSDYCTVALDPVSSRRGAGRRKYLKFRTQAELNKWGFVREQKIRCERCLHIADGTEIVFDVTNVEFL